MTCKLTVIQLSPILLSGGRPHQQLPFRTVLLHVRMCCCIVLPGPRAVCQSHGCVWIDHNRRDPDMSQLKRRNACGMGARGVPPERKADGQLLRHSCRPSRGVLP